MEGTKAELNQQLTTYLGALTLSDDQKAFLYDALKFSQKQYKSGNPESSGGTGGGGKKAKAFTYSAAASPPTGNANLKTVSSAPVSIARFQTPDNSAQLQNILNALQGMIRGGQSNIKNATLQTELEQIDQNPLLSGSQKAARKRAIQERYAQ